MGTSGKAIDLQSKQKQCDVVCEILELRDKQKDIAERIGKQYVHCRFWSKRNYVGTFVISLGVCRRLPKAHFIATACEQLLPSLVNECRHHDTQVSVYVALSSVAKYIML